MTRKTNSPDKKKLNNKWHNIPVHFILFLPGWANLQHR